MTTNRSIDPEKEPLLQTKGGKMGLVRDLEENDATSVESNYVEFTSKKWPQFAASFVAGMSLLSVGMTMVWTSPALPDLEKSDKFEDLTTTDKSWIASIVTLGAVVSGPIAGILADRWGRKTCLFIVSIPFLIGWLLIAFAPTVLVMIIGRFILGVCVGAFILAGVLYNTEICESNIRGTVMAMSMLYMGFGMLATYGLGALLSWFALTLVDAGIALALIFVLPFLPETPVYLISKGRRELAEKSMMRLRGASEPNQVKKELDEIQAHVLEMEETKKRIQGTLWTNLKRPGTLKALGISLVLAALQQLCGLNAVNFYTADIFAAGNTDIDENISSVIMGAVLIFTGLISTQIMDRFGRRTLLNGSLVGLAFCLTALGAFFYAYREDENGESPKPPPTTAWIPLASLILFQFFYNTGIGPLAWLMMGEILPMDVKGPTSAFVTSFNWVLAFLVTFSFESIADWIGIWSCFWIFGAVAVVGLVFCSLFVPETNGKTLEEIHRLYFS